MNEEAQPLNGQNAKIESEQSNSTFGKILGAVLAIDDTMKDLILSPSISRPKRSGTIVTVNGETTTTVSDHEHHDDGCIGAQKHAFTLLVSIGKALTISCFTLYTMVWGPYFDMAL